MAKFIFPWGTDQEDDDDARLEYSLLEAADRARMKTKDESDCHCCGRGCDCCLGPFWGGAPGYPTLCKQKEPYDDDA